MGEALDDERDGATCDGLLPEMGTITNILDGALVKPICPDFGCLTWDRKIQW